MISKRRGPGPNRVLVSFRLPSAIWGDSVHLVGDFNQWDEQSLPMAQGEDGWMLELELEQARSYEFRYLVDGQEWINDCRADDYVPNPYGGYNSVVRT
jgi:1,4-alpha-glucan branching enzyme